MIATPFFLRSSICLKSMATSVSLIAEVGSSMMTSEAWREMALVISINCMAAIESSRICMRGLYLCPSLSSRACVSRYMRLKSTKVLNGDNSGLPSMIGSRPR